VTESPSGPVELEIERAKQCLRSAEILAAAGQHTDAVSRAYYAAFHAACALLASIGRSVRTHDGASARSWSSMFKVVRMTATSLRSRCIEIYIK
jgi:uncharacterized protein (UPF0332 family)